MTNPMKINQPNPADEQNNQEEIHRCVRTVAALISLAVTILRWLNIHP